MLVEAVARAAEILASTSFRLSVKSELRKGDYRLSDEVDQDTLLQIEPVRGWRLRG